MERWREMKRGKERERDESSSVSFLFASRWSLKFCTLNCVSRNIHDCLRRNEPMDILQVHIVLTWRILMHCAFREIADALRKKRSDFFYPENYGREITVDRF